jgi:hypothetical protein
LEPGVEGFLHRAAPSKKLADLIRRFFNNTPFLNISLARLPVTPRNDLVLGSAVCSFLWPASIFHHGILNVIALMLLRVS